MADSDMTEPGTWVQTEFASYSVFILGAIIISQAFNAFATPSATIRWTCC